MEAQRTHRALRPARPVRSGKALGKVFADGALLREEIEGLLEQNDERRSRKLLKRNVVGRGKIMSYEDIVAVREQRVQRDASKRSKQGVTGRRKS